VLVVAVGFISG